MIYGSILLAVIAFYAVRWLYRAVVRSVSDAIDKSLWGQ